MATLDQQQLLHSNNIGDRIRENDYVAQTFQAGLSGTLSSVRIWLNKYGTPANFIVEIQTLTGINPSGFVLATSDEISPASIEVPYLLLQN